jgi:hypothetical protein
MRVDAFHLPALPSVPTSSWRYGEGEQVAVELRIPALEPAALTRQIDALLAARESYLASRSIASIIDVVDAVARRLLDPADEMRRVAEAVLPAVTGASREMIRHVLDRMAADWRAEGLRRVLHADVGDERVLDAFHAAEGERSLRRAFGPPLMLHVFSGNVPGVSVTSLVRALLVKSASLGKTAAGEPLLAALFARGIAEADAGLGACLAVTYWPGGDDELERCALERASAVIAYGSAETIRSLRSRTPAATTFLGYGHRLSFGVLAREALTSEGAPRLAEAAARQVATFDQQGCVSPHLFYAEEGGEVEPEAWASMLARAMAALEDELPRGALAPGEAAAIRQLRGEAEFAQIAGRGHVLHASGGGTAWTVIYDPQPDFIPSCLNRLVRVKPVAEVLEVADHAEAVASVLQTVGMAGPAARLSTLAERLARAGASRLCPLERMAWPPPDWRHDGRPPLGDLLRWCDWEPASGSAIDRSAGRSI